jgi:probable phosphoglycerate mutase
VVDPDLAEWDYGAYEGVTTNQIREERPGWELFADGVPDGESIEDVAARVDRVIARVRATPGDVACVAHSHVLRVLAARWIGLDPGVGRSLVLDPAAVSELGWDREHPVVLSWNRH